MSINSGLLASPLITEGVLAQYLEEKRDQQIPSEERRAKSIAEWVASLPLAKIKKETSLEQEFNQAILVTALGYTLVPDPKATAWPKAPSSLTGIAGEPDVVLGSFPYETLPSITAVVELKSPGTPMDLPQAREGHKTPVEQAFEYAETILGVRWVIVSDMRYIRLYSVESSSEYLAFDLAKCVDPEGRPTKEFIRLFYLLSVDYLVIDGAESSTARLVTKSIARQLEIRDSFYGVYYQIRLDLYAAIQHAVLKLQDNVSNDILLEATQRLLDRMVFLNYCEDHPDRLVPQNVVRDVTLGARRLPGPSDHKVYDSLKLLFREVDSGSPSSSGVQISAYNGELFKLHPIIDYIELPDSLHDRLYSVDLPGGAKRAIQGVWGLYVFDFWQELNEHLLGHIFEESLSDIVQLAQSGPVDIAAKLAERRRHGIYFTTQILSDFLTTGAIRSLLAEAQPGEVIATDSALLLNERLNHLTRLRIVDFACGSGAFLVSAYRELQREFWRLHDAIGQLQVEADDNQLDLTVLAATITQSKLLRDSLYGSDLLPQAVEIAKLALWLRSARKGERIPDLGGNIVAGDSLEMSAVLAQMHAADIASFDLVCGNPPWGGEIDEAVYQDICGRLSISQTPPWDSWELFIALGLRLLREGGRLAMVLPDTIFSPEKERTRRLLLDSTHVEKFHNLGPDWFGKQVRMGTVVLQARKGPKPLLADIQALLLTGPLRRKAIVGGVPLTQIEAQFSRFLPQERSERSPTAEIEVFRSRRDDNLMGTMETNGIPLSELCTRGRGEELSKAGLLWVCPSCLKTSVPGRKTKGGHYEPKSCPHCGFGLTEANVSSSYLVLRNKPLGIDTAHLAPFIDGDDISHRYKRVVLSKWIQLGIPEWQYKPAALYLAPKVLIRQAGVGIWATYDETGAYCPQSVYLYRLNPDRMAQGYRHEFVLGALLSRTLTYYVFKRFGEVEPARAHAKLTHERLAELPIPMVDFTNPAQRAAHDAIVADVRWLLEGQAILGGPQDLEIELNLRHLWRIEPEDGAYINGEFLQLPNSQAIKDLFPSGRPLIRAASELVIPLEEA
jgi:N-6 DNA Methylase/TaqI-like C-terminal specificity domain